MTCGPVQFGSYSLPEWQAVKLTFFAPCMLHVGSFYGKLAEGKQ